jgi:hypothetical protein
MAEVNGGSTPKNTMPKGMRPPWKKGESGNPKGRPKQDPKVREILLARLPEMAQRLVELALNVSGDVPPGVQIRALEAGFDRCEGKPETKVTVSGRVDFAHLLAEYTEQHKAIEGQCEVLDTTQDATHSEGEGGNTSNNNDVHD